jgi:uncharacterized short protein YbdD (DUF466 family)
MALQSFSRINWRFSASFPEFVTVNDGIVLKMGYVTHRRANHPDLPVMTYQEFFRERQQARYTVTKGRLRGCC